MPLQENLPADQRRSGTASTFDDTSGSRGTSPLTRRLFIIAMKTATAPAATDTPVQVFSEREARLLAGVSSECALQVEWAYKQWRKLSVRRAGAASAQVFIVPVADPAGTAAIHRFAASGTATEGGNMIIFVAGRRIPVPITNGADATATATAIDTAIDSVAQTLPITSASAVGNCDVTAVNTGTNGNRILIGVDQSTVPAGLTVTPSQEQTSGVGTASIIGALAAILGDEVSGDDYTAISIANHLAQDVTDIGAHMDTAWAPTVQKFRHAHIGVNETLGTSTTLATGGNRKEININNAENLPNTPGEIAVVIAAVNLSQTKPAYNHNQTELVLFPPQDSDDHYQDAEVETALGGGVSPITVKANGSTQLERLFTTKTTEGGAAFEDLRSLKNSKTGAHVAKAIDARLKITQIGRNLDADYLRLIRREALRQLRFFESQGDLHRVDEHLEELRAAVSAAVVDRALLEIPYSVVPDANQVDATFRLFREAAEI